MEGLIPITPKATCDLYQEIKTPRGKKFNNTHEPIDEAADIPITTTDPNMVRKIHDMHIAKYYHKKGGKNTLISRRK